MNHNDLISRLRAQAGVSSCASEREMLNDAADVIEASDERIAIMDTEAKSERCELKYCLTCKWRGDPFTSVCANDVSDHYADYVRMVDVCEQWEAETCRLTGQCAGN